MSSPKHSSKGIDYDAILDNAPSLLHESIKADRDDTAPQPRIAPPRGDYRGLVGMNERDAKATAAELERVKQQLDTRIRLYETVRDENQSLRTERDELLAALKELSDNADYMSLNRARAAIAKAEKEAK